jgi:hypothetical protein
MTKLALFNRDMVPDKLIELLIKVIDVEVIHISSVYFVNELADNDEDIEPFGRFYPEIGAVAINLGKILNEVTVTAENDRNKLRFSALLWIQLMGTALHEFYHAMEHENKPFIFDEDKANEWAIKTAFTLAKYTDIEPPAQWSGLLQKEIDDFNARVGAANAEDKWAETQRACAQYGCVEYDLGNDAFVPTIKKMAQLHFGSNDPEWEEPYAEDVPAKEEDLPFEPDPPAQNNQTTLQKWMDNNGIDIPHDVPFGNDSPGDDMMGGYDPTSDQPFEPPLPMEQMEQPITSPQPQPQPQPVDPNNPLVILLMRLHQHIYDKCGWIGTPSTPGFVTPAQVASPVFIGDIPGIADLITFYDGVNSIGQLVKGNIVHKTLNGYVSRSGQPCYRIMLANGTSRLIKPVMPNTKKTWGQQAISGAKRLMVLQDGKMTSVVEQAPNEEAVFRPCSQ